MELMEHQQEAIRQLDNGKVLFGGVGSGKTATALGYYVQREPPRDIVVITTARKRDSLDWETEAIKFGISTDRELSLYGSITVDSWNNIGKYTDFLNYFFIFDEQRVVGKGAWVKSFIKIARKNRWILLSATPGDTWLDYAPIFVANGYYKNLTDFKSKHVVYEAYLNYPKVKYYMNEEKLELLRNEVLVEMPFAKNSKRAINYWDVDYDRELFNRVFKDRWNVYTEEPIKDAAELFRVMRRVVNSDPSRLDEIINLNRLHPRLIVFYNFDYELEDLRLLAFHCPTYEWNGHVKQDHRGFENEERWIYLVQYVAGAEAWNCTTTNAMVLYSLTYSYKNFQQALGRIDRLDSPFDTLYYYIFLSNSFVDQAIKRSLDHKENFNERKALLETMNFRGESKEEIDEPLEVCQI